MPSRLSLLCHEYSANCFNRYIRALEERVIELESQIPDERPENLSASRQSTTLEYLHQRGNETDHVSQASIASKSPYSRGVPRDRTAADSIPLRLSAPCPSLALPFPHAVESLPDPHGQCGHSSLLIGILATLTGPETPVLSQIQSEGPNDRNIYEFTDRIVQADRVPRLSIEASDRLVQIYLERVNPRYPFLHLATFLGWYESWKAQSQMDRARHQQSLWKDYFVTMVWIKHTSDFELRLIFDTFQVHAVALLLTPRVSVDDITTSQVCVY